MLLPITTIPIILKILVRRTTSIIRLQQTKPQTTSTSLSNIKNSIIRNISIQSSRTNNSTTINSTNKILIIKKNTRSSIIRHNNTSNILTKRILSRNHTNNTLIINVRLKHTRRISILKQRMHNKRSATTNITSTIKQNILTPTNILIKNKRTRSRLIQSLRSTNLITINKSTSH